MFKKQLFLICLLTSLTVGVFADVAFSKDITKYEIRWGTAPAGGVWQALGTAMLDDVLRSNPNLTGSTLPLGGAANVVAVHEGKLNVAFSFSTMAAEAWDGKEFFQKYGKLRNIRELAVLFPEPTQFVVWADSGITDVRQLKGKRITPGPKGSAIAPITRYVLEACGISFKDVKVQFLSFREAGQQMIDGHIDAILYGAMAYPAPPIVNVSSQRQIRLLSLPEEVIAEVLKKHKGLERYTLPPGSYKGVNYPVKGIAAYVIVIGSKDMPEDVAYAVVKSIAENFNRYTTVTKAIALGKPEDMGKDIGIPMHPGAVRYYKERGWLK